MGGIYITSRILLYIHKTPLAVSSGSIGTIGYTSNSHCLEKNTEGFINRILVFLFSRFSPD